LSDTNTTTTTRDWSHRGTASGEWYSDWSHRGTARAEWQAKAEADAAMTRPTCTRGKR